MSLFVIASQTASSVYIVSQQLWLKREFSKLLEKLNFEISRQSSKTQNVSVEQPSNGCRLYSSN